jgi:hypothetical protein
VAAAIKAEVPTELRDEVRALTLARLDVIIKRNMIRLGSPAASPAEQDRAEDMILKITDRIVDITGARAPIKIDATVTDAIDEEIAILVADLTRPLSTAPGVGPPRRTDDDRIDPDLSRGSGRWQGRMRRTDADRGYDDPSVP